MFYKHREAIRTSSKVFEQRCDQFPSAFLKAPPSCGVGDEWSGANKSGQRASNELGEGGGVLYRATMES